MKELSILDVKISAYTKKKILEKIGNLLSSETTEGKQLITINPEFVIAAQADMTFKNIINNSWLVVADGYGIRLAAKYLELINNKHINNYVLRIINYFLIGLKVAWWGVTKNNKKIDTVSESTTGTDLIPEICRIMKNEPKIGNKKVFLLGGFGDVPRLTAEKLQATVSLETHNGVSLQIDYAPFEEQDIIEKINLFSPAMLFVALNHPRAQKWIAENLARMPSVKLAIGVGGAFDYLSGETKRASQEWRNSFEWLFRLIHQPRRWKRIYSAVFSFPWRIFMSVSKRGG
ncbi:WecB/TagA/CpsF family glycosyltransferase [Candidatus Kuenenbacteria bacterium]|nr:WecB/TagA/CpsF family glycosyltransferase [Candidatus Kuenenbacteria bacterium]